MTPAESSLPMRKPHHARRRLRLAGMGLLAGIVGVGLLHLPIASRLMARLGGCPFASAKLTPAQMDTARHWALASRKGQAPAPARPALGFSLDETSPEAVHQWARREHVACDDVRPGVIVCASVPSRAVGQPPGDGSIDELSFGFNARGKLVNLTTMRTHLRPPEASSVSRHVVETLREALGRPTRFAGILTPAYLGQPGALGMATVSYQYEDYVAELEAMSLPSSGLSVREHYVSASD